MANTYSFRDNFATKYQETLYRQPVYRSIAREAIAPKLYEGQTLKRSWISRFSAGEVGSDGSYDPQSFVATPETLTVDQKPEVSTNIVEWQDMLDDLRTGESEIPEQFAATMFNYIDGRILGVTAAGAGSTVDNADLGGVAGDGIPVTVSNVQNLFTLAFERLVLKNAMQGAYSPVKKFSGVKSQDMGARMPVAIIDAHTYSLLQLSLGSRWTPQGDKVTTNGFIDFLFGFNIFLSNNLRWSGQFDVTASNLLNGETLTIGPVTLVGVTGTPTNPGEFKIEAAAADTATNIKNFLNSPYTTIAGKSIAFVKASIDSDSRILLKSIASPSITSTTKVNVTVDGQSAVIVSDTAGNGAWTPALSICNMIFGTSQMVDVAMVSQPKMYKRPVSGKLSNDLVMASLGGWKVFHEQSPRIVNIKARTAAYTLAPAN